MIASLEFSGIVADAKLPRLVEEKLRASLSQLEGRRVRLRLDEAKRVRSTNQNSYYWGVVVKSVTRMFREAGNYVDDEDVHEFLKLRVGKLSQILVSPDGEVHKSLGSTKKLSTTEFEEYLERVRVWAAEIGCVIPLPNESTTKDGEA